VLFDRACSLIGVAADGCLLVGDHPVNDVVGAKSG
jgi:FMN phosphatase YigB (HAD superfamily)